MHFSFLAFFFRTGPIRGKQRRCCPCCWGGLLVVVVECAFADRRLLLAVWHLGDLDEPPCHGSSPCYSDRHRVQRSHDRLGRGPYGLGGLSSRAVDARKHRGAYLDDRLGRWAAWIGFGRQARAGPASETCGRPSIAKVRPCREFAILAKMAPRASSNSQAHREAAISSTAPAHDCHYLGSQRRFFSPKSG